MTAPVECASCHKPTQDTCGVCHPCRKATLERLKLLEDGVADLQAVYLKQTRQADDGGGRRSRDVSPFPYNEQAARALKQVRSILERWHVTDFRDLPAAAGRWARERAQHTPAAAWPRLAHDTRTLADLCHVAYTRPATMMPIGPCPEQDAQGDPCNGTVYHYRPATDTQPHWQCGICGAEWHVVSWTAAGDAIRARQAVLDQQQRLAQQLARKRTR